MAIVEKRGDAYLIRVSLGYDGAGKQIRKNMTWSPNPGMTTKQIKKELGRQSILFEEKVRSGRYVDSNIKFADFVDIWLKDYAEKNLAPKTLFDYKRLLVRACKSIGHLRLDRIQPIHLLALYNELANPGERGMKLYKPSKNIRKMVKASGKIRHQIAVDGGISEQTIYTAVRGRSINERSAIRLCKAINVKLEDAFSLVGKDSPLSGNTVLHYHKIISSVLHTAVEWQVILDNPASRVKAPKINKRESRYLDETDARRLVEMLQNEPIQYRTMIILLLYSGIRRGELCGLKWSDLDFANNVLHIRRAIQYLPAIGVYVKEPKNSSSIRALKLPDIALQLLREHRAWQNSERLRLGELWQQEDREKVIQSGVEWIDPNWIFTRWNGSVYVPDALSRWFRGFVNAHDLPDVSVHSLRHTNASLMIASGTNIRTVSKRLGHAQTSTTANIYAHAISSADEAASEKIGDILNIDKHPISATR
jgi:integrase